MKIKNTVQTFKTRMSCHVLLIKCEHDINKEKQIKKGLPLRRLQLNRSGRFRKEASRVEPRHSLNIQNSCGVVNVLAGQNGRKLFYTKILSPLHTISLRLGTFFGEVIEEAERRTAFYDETLELPREPVIAIGEKQNTWAIDGDAAQNMSFLRYKASAAGTDEQLGCGKMENLCAFKHAVGDTNRPMASHWEHCIGFQGPSQIDEANKLHTVSRGETSKIAVNQLYTTESMDVILQLLD